MCIRDRESDVRLDRSRHPEFDTWRWVDYWRPVSEVVSFKREVYRKALTELAPVLFHDCEPPAPPAVGGGTRRVATVVTCPPGE